MSETKSVSKEKDIAPKNDQKSDCLEIISAAASQSRKSKKHSDWPLCDIKEPHQNDVLYGRGGGTNHHSGNKRYRKMVEGRKVDYVNSKRLDKPLVALEIIKEWRSQDPPGRFLKMDETTGSWSDVGDKKAREKTSQALREKAPLLRKQQEEERLVEEPDGEVTKNTRFNIPEKKKTDKRLARATLLRDHSLGRDYLETDESVGLQGFSWEQGITYCSKSGEEKWRKHVSEPRDSGYHVDSYENVKTPTVMIPRQENYHGISPSRNDSLLYPTTNSRPVDERNPLVTPTRETNESLNWSQPYRSRSAEGTPTRWGKDIVDYPHRQIFHTRSLGNDDQLCYEKEHRNTYLGSDDYAKCVDILSKDNTKASQDWRHQQSDYYHYDEGISVKRDSRGEWTSPTRRHPQRFNHEIDERSRYSDAYNFAPIEKSSKFESSSFSSNDTTAVPQSFTGMNIHKNGAHFGMDGNLSRLSSEVLPCDQIPYLHNNTPIVSVSPSEASTPSKTPRNSNIPKPQPVKRETSHQNENSETKRQVKKMNRQPSIGNRVATSLEQVSETDMTSLRNTLKHSTLESEGIQGHPSHGQQTNYVKSNCERPKSLNSSQRVSTMDLFELAIESSSSHIDKTYATVDQSDLPDHDVRVEKDSLKINRDFFPDCDSLLDNRKISTGSSDTTRFPPSCLTSSDRLSTLGSIDLDLGGDDFAKSERVEAI